MVLENYSPFTALNILFTRKERKREKKRKKEEGTRRENGILIVPDLFVRVIVKLCVYQHGIIK